MNEKQFRVQEHCLRSSYGIEAENWLVTNDNHSVVLTNKSEAHMVANMLNDAIDVLNELYEENIELKMKIQKVEEIIDNRLSNDFKPVWNDGKTELFIEEKVGYRFALEQLKKKLIRENIIKGDKE